MLPDTCNSSGGASNEQFVVNPPRQRRNRLAPWAHVPKAAPARNIGFNMASITAPAFVVNTDQQLTL